MEEVNQLRRYSINDKQVELLIKAIKTMLYDKLRESGEPHV